MRIHFVVLRLASVVILGAFVYAQPPETPKVVPVENEPLHRVVCQNQFVRVFDVVLRPGDVSLFHRHTHDMAGISITDAPGWDEVLGAARKDTPADKDGEAWFVQHEGTQFVHRVANTGDRIAHLAAVELLYPPRTNSDASTLEPLAGFSTQLENLRVRISRVVLLPGESTREHSHTARYVLIAVGSGRILNTSGDAPAKVAEVAPGFVLWGEQTTKHAVTNTGVSPLELDEIEFK